MTPEDTRKPCFQHGRLVISPGVIDLARRGRLDVIYFFDRHLHGDWGDVRLVRGIINESALKNGGQLVSIFQINSKQQMLIVTKSDRSATTLLLSQEEESFKADLAD